MCGYSYSSTIHGAKPWRHLSSGFTTRNGPVTDYTKGDGTGKIPFIILSFIKLFA